MVRPEVIILMASYNGESFIKEQIQSIIDQHHTNWKLFVRDDGSKDNTVRIIKAFEHIDDRVHLIQDKKANLGSCQNFSALLQHPETEGPYIMFADQDDLWLPDKITVTLRKMLEAESEAGTGFPMLVFTQFTYTDEKLIPINSMQHFDPVKVKEIQFRHMLVQNPAYGCTMMLNAALKKMVGTIPMQAENHDYWIALTAAALGKIFYLKRRTILYRQHAKNSSGNFDNNSFNKRFKRIFFNKYTVQDVERKFAMAEAFHKRYGNILSEENIKILQDYLQLSRRRSFYMIIKNLRNGIRRQTISQSLLFYLTILLMPAKNLRQTSGIE